MRPVKDEGRLITQRGMNLLESIPKSDTLISPLPGFARP